jgi:hypothetical protein
VFVVMMAATNMDKYPSFFFEPGDDLATGHRFIVHTVHIVSTSMNQQAT